MLTLVDFAKAYDVTRSTVRNWSKEFGDYLSPFATPPQGDQREFTDHDAAVIALIAEKRARHIPYVEIHAALAGGERGIWPPPGYKKQEETPPPGDAPDQLTTQLFIQLSKTEGKLAAIEEERDYLRLQLDHARQEAQAAAVAAARAQGELATLQAIMQTQAAPQTQEAQETAVSPDPPAPDHAPDPPPSLAAAIRAWWSGRRSS
jgi:DNA-binding transcriptional MerR regulator